MLSYSSQKNPSKWCFEKWWTFLFSLKYPSPKLFFSVVKYEEEKIPHYFDVSARLSNSKKISSHFFLQPKMCLSTQKMHFWKLCRKFWAQSPKNLCSKSKKIYDFQEKMTELFLSTLKMQFWQSGLQTFGSNSENFSHKVRNFSKNAFLKVFLWACRKKFRQSCRR